VRLRCGWSSACVTILLNSLVLTASLAEPSLLNSSPGSAHIAISGPATLSGSAPLSISGLPIGEYSLTGDGPGLPAIKGRFVRLQNGIAGRPWSEATAAVLPPGLIHLSRGEKRGWVFFDAAVVSAAMSFRGQGRVRSSEQDRDGAAAAYQGAVTESDILGARRTLFDAGQKVNDEREVRNLWMGYLAYTWFGSAMESIFLTAQPAIRVTEGGEYLVTFPRAGGWQACIRSAIVPGAGQRYMGHSGRANLSAAATAILAGGTIFAHDQFLEARRNQANAQWRFDHAESDTDASLARRDLQRAANRTDGKNLIQWSVGGALAGIYLWNIVDSFGLGHGAKAPALTMSVAPSSNGVLFGARWSVQ